MVIELRIDSSLNTAKVTAGNRYVAPARRSGQCLSWLLAPRPITKETIEQQRHFRDLDTLVFVRVEMLIFESNAGAEKDNNLASDLRQSLYWVKA